VVTKSSLCWEIHSLLVSTGSEHVYLLHAGILFTLLFYPEDGSDMLFRNMGWLYGVISEKTALQETKYISE
jgi:hypothetical protein